MSNIAIHVEKLAKRYRIGLKEEMHDTFAAAIAHTLRQPLRNLRRLRRLTSFDEQEAEDIVWALRDVSFEVNRGEVVGVIGRNGAGKSTLLKLLSRITHPTSGRIELRGRVSSLLEVGTGFHPELTGRENVYLNGTILGMRKAEIDRKFDEIVDFSGIHQYIDTPVKRYSSGMGVRLAFSVAAHLEPEILLIDEVLAVGDVEFQRKCLGKMETVAGEGRTILFVSHNMSAILNLCSRTILIDKGQIAADGTTSQVVQRYLNEGTILENVDLRDHPDRRRGSAQLMTQVRLLKMGELSSTFVTHEPFCFQVECDIEDRVYRHLSLGFLITDSFGHVVFGSNLRQFEQMVPDPKGAYMFELSIDKLPLNPGTYSLSLFLDDGGRTIDVIRNVTAFDVLWNRTLDLAFPPLSDWGATHVPLSWRVEPQLALTTAD